MTDKEILEKAIQKAIDRGWNPEEILGGWDETSEQVKDIVIKSLIEYGTKTGYMLLIFNHDFAKAIWVNSTLTNGQVYLQSLWSAYDEYPSFDGEPWQFHLQQMVIADDPIKYLGENI